MDSSAKHHSNLTLRSQAALRMLFVADALAMPVHWYYNALDIEKAFPGGIRTMEAAPIHHPSSIMALHSVTHGGRKAKESPETSRQIVGGVILKDKGDNWGKQNLHYHHGMAAGENTLNAYCARIAIRVLTETAGRYDKSRFLDDYIEFMTSEVPLHPDTYAESYHRGFFANLADGKPKDQCGAVTHDTPSIGGLVTIAPIAIAELLGGKTSKEVQSLCREHLFLTHPDLDLALVCDAYIDLIDALLFRKNNQSPKACLKGLAQRTLGLNLQTLTAQASSDRDVVGGRFSTACYINGSWPSVLYLAYKYLDQPKQGLLANANLGGDNVHRGAVLGIILGLCSGQTVMEFFSQLVDRQAIDAEIKAFLSAVVAS